jgi:hypothetical protein
MDARRAALGLTEDEEMQQFDHDEHPDDVELDVPPPRAVTDGDPMPVDLTYDEKAPV